MTSSSRVDLGLLALRVGLGVTMAVHGSQKLFGWFGGHGIKATAAGMQQMGYQPAQISAVAAGLGEAGGGALLAVGLATPVGGAAVAATMASAAAVHAPAGFFATEGGLEYQAALALTGAALAITGAALAITGPGRYSLDELLNHRTNRPWMAAAALVSMAAAGAAIQIRRQRHMRTQTDNGTSHPEI